jgi:hypothetical protein
MLKPQETPQCPWSICQRSASCPRPNGVWLARRCANSYPEVCTPSGRPVDAQWTPSPTATRLNILAESGRHRTARLLPIRYDRMRASAFDFFCGAAAIMAADLADTVTSGLWVQACGDCYQANFGTFVSPEGTPASSDLSPGKTSNYAAPRRPDPARSFFTETIREAACRPAPWQHRSPWHWCDWKFLPPSPALPPA